MVKHIVLFKLKPFPTEKEKTEKSNEIKNRLEALLHIVPELRKIEVGINMNPAEKWDIVLLTEFDSMKDLETYANHPAHVEVSKNIISGVKEDRACVDFTF